MFRIARLLAHHRPRDVRLDAAIHEPPEQIARSPALMDSCRGVSLKPELNCEWAGLIGRCCRTVAVIRPSVMLPAGSGHASDDDSGAAFGSRDSVGSKSLRSAVAIWCMNDTQIWSQLELERVEAEGQSLSNGFQRRFLQAPELKECSRARRTSGRNNEPRLGPREELVSEFYHFQVPCSIFNVDTNSVYRRPRREKTDPA